MTELAGRTTSGAVDPQEAGRSLEAMVDRLQKLKRKLEETKQEELMYTTRTKQRLDHLEELANIQYMDTDVYERWSKIRLDRMLVDYMLRTGRMNTADKLSKDAEIEVGREPGLNTVCDRPLNSFLALCLQNFVDIELFAQSKVIEDALMRRSCTEALAWCAENRSNLKKQKVGSWFWGRVVSG